MGRLKSIVKTFEVQTAQRRRTCTGTNQRIAKGEKCLVIRDGYRDEHPYCREQALKIVEDGLNKLKALKRELE